MSKIKTLRQKLNRAAFILGDDHPDVIAWRMAATSRQFQVDVAALRAAKQAQIDALTRRQR